MLVYSKMWPLLIVMIVQAAVSSEDMKSKAGVNPEQFMNISERIQYWGYPSKEYEVLTADGYYLSLNRIPGGSKGAVLLIHSLDVEGGSLVANPPRSSPAFILADGGYDVWIGNNRGNSWSRRHEYLTIDQQEFWDFSFHELAIYDFPAFIDFILQKTGQERIYCVAHAEGSTIVFFAFSVLPQLASKVKMLFALGPPYTLQYSIAPLLQLLRLPDIFLKIIFGTKEFCLLGPRLRALMARTCSWPVMDVLCKQALFLVSGFNEKNLNKLAKTGKPRYFDYGSENIKKYNQTVPPPYKIEEITVPIAMWSGGHDWVARSKETAQLRSRLKNIIHYRHFSDWVHWDYIWGLDAPQRMYSEILSLMEYS
ncbi:PREDICTED: putative lysosomal acid lipase/cholesteryl ester hydrolase isoform X2 [Gekko japonicus]|uniref:Lipase n=1 Tax=Gekko japonicus TaxID=146911 RepID=A0ABM1JX54_GEKJA|nr:PREDICTED: putative lysosomal acid lipase/cholesteryl ester hydrolase isoform X2 [Gekko japonicus]